MMLKSLSIDTPLGSMIAIADEKALYLLEFLERRDLSREIERLKKRLKTEVLPGKTEPLAKISVELADYFSGKNLLFKTPYQIMGTEFQQTVWQALCEIPAGETQSYLDIAKAIDRPTASRAVARANSINQLALIIPCHRVVNSSGALGGYAGGVERKQWLLDHERRYQ